MADRSFPPSPKRLALAREAGVVVHSRMLVAGVVCAAALAGQGLIVEVATQVAGLAAHSWERSGRAVDQDSLSESMRVVMDDGAGVSGGVLRVMVVMLLAAAGAVFLQVGPVWAVFPRRARAALGGVRSERAWLVMLCGTACVALCVLLVALALWRDRLGVAMLADGEVVAGGAARVARALTRTLAYLAGGLVVLGVIELVAGRLLLRSRLCMTRDEVMREEREGGGGGSARRVDNGWVWAEQLAAVPAATVVLRSDAVAVALRYDGAEGQAPMVVAVARRAKVAELCDVASSSGVIVLDVESELAEDLARSGPLSQVPGEWYERVGQLLEVVLSQQEAAGRPRPNQS